MLFFDSKKKVEFVDVENIHLGEHWELKRVRVYHTYILKNPWEILENAIWVGWQHGAGWLLSGGYHQSIEPCHRDFSLDLWWVYATCAFLGVNVASGKKWGPGKTWIYIPRAPKTSIFVKVIPPQNKAFSNQNKGQVPRYIYRSRALFST